MNKSIERLLKNYSNARKSFEVWCFMVSIEDSGNKRSIKHKVDKNELLFHLRYLAFKDFHIELYKVLKRSKNNKDNIFQLLDSTIKNRPREKSAINKTAIRLAELKEGIKKIIDLRDKFYAHLDEDYNNYLNKTSLPYSMIFEAIEQSIMSITSKEILLEALNRIPSRKDYSLDI